MEGVRFFAGNRVLVALLGLIVVASLGTGAQNSLDVFFVTRNLHAASKYFGFVETAFGIGAIVGGLTAGAVTRRTGAKTVTWLSTVLTGLLLLLFARQTAFVPALALLGVCGVVLTTLNAGLTPLMLKEIPSQYMGRAMAVFNPAQQFAQMLSMALAGLLVSTALRNFHPSVLGIRMGPIDTIFTGSGLLFVAAGVVALLVMPKDRVLLESGHPAGEGLNERGGVVPGVPGGVQPQQERGAVAVSNGDRADVEPGVLGEHADAEASRGESLDNPGDLALLDAAVTEAGPDDGLVQDLPGHVVAGEEQQLLADEFGRGDADPAG
jgi:MFS family permease